MRPAIAFAVAAPALFFALACSGMSMGGGYENVAACKSYLDKYNGLACIKDNGATIKPEDMCPAALDMSPCDMTSYYECMEKEAKCNGKIPDLAGQTSCKPAC